MAFRPLVLVALAALALPAAAGPARLKGTAEARPGMTLLTGGVGLSFLFFSAPARLPARFSTRWSALQARRGMRR